MFILHYFLNTKFHEFLKYLAWILCNIRFSVDTDRNYFHLSKFFIKRSIWVIFPLSVGLIAFLGQFKHNHKYIECQTVRQIYEFGSICIQIICILLINPWIKFLTMRVKSFSKLLWHNDTMMWLINSNKISWLIIHFT